MIRRFLMLVVVLMLVILIRNYYTQGEEIKPIANLGAVYYGMPEGELISEFCDDFIKSEREQNRVEKKRYRLIGRELGIKEKLYIGHPQFINLNLDAGVKFATGHVDYDDSEILTRLFVGGKVLTKAPYSGNFVFSKQRLRMKHLVSVDYFSDQIYGEVNFFLKEKIIGWPLRISFNYLSKDSEDIFENDNDFQGYELNIREIRKDFNIETNKKWKGFDINLSLKNSFYDRDFTDNDISDKTGYVTNYFSGVGRRKFFRDERLRIKTDLRLNSQRGKPGNFDLDLGQEARYKFFDNAWHEFDSFLKLNANIDRRDAINSKAINSRGDFQDKNDSFGLQSGLSHRFCQSIFTSLKTGIEKISTSSFEEWSFFLIGGLDM